MNIYLTFWTGRWFLRSSTSGIFTHSHSTYVLPKAVIIKYTRLETVVFFFLSIYREIFGYNSQRPLKLVIVFQLVVLVLAFDEFMLLGAYIVYYTVSV